jgi:DNA-binding transcriptional ArsR family regulator
MKMPKEHVMVRVQNQAKALDQVFGAIADATRRSMLDRLRAGPLTVTELAGPYAMSLNAVSKHVKTLERAGLISRRISGRIHSCSLNAGKLEDAGKWISYYSEFWTQRLDRLEQHLLEKPKRGNQRGNS